MESWESFCSIWASSGDKSRNSGISSIAQWQTIHEIHQCSAQLQLQLSRGPPQTAHKEGHMEIVHCRHDNSAAENLSFSQWYTLVIRRFYRLKSTAARETFLHKHDSCHVVVLDFDPIFVGRFWCWEITKTDSKNSNFAWHIFEHLIEIVMHKYAIEFLISGLAFQLVSA